MRLFRFCWCAEHVIQLCDDQSDIGLEIVMPSEQRVISGRRGRQAGCKSSVKLLQLLCQTGDSFFQPFPRF